MSGQCARPHPEDSPIPATIQRVVNPVEGFPYTEWLCPDRVSFTADAKAEHYQGPYREALALAQKLSAAAGHYIYPVDIEVRAGAVEAPAVPERMPRASHPRSTGRSLGSPGGFSSQEHNAGRPRVRPELDVRDLRALEEHEIYD